MAQWRRDEKIALPFCVPNLPAPVDLGCGGRILPSGDVRR